jgi:hypothetical protein
MVAAAVFGLGSLAAGCSAEIALPVESSAGTEVAEPTTPLSPEPEAPTPAGLPTAEPSPTTTSAEPTIEIPPPESLGALGEIRGVASLPPAGADYAEYVEISDDDGLIAVTVPSEWTDTDGRPWAGGDFVEGDEPVGPALSVSPDVAAFTAGWGTPGVFIGASDRLPFESVGDLLEASGFDEECVLDSTRPYDDGVYRGVFDLYVECGPEMSVFVNLVAEPADGSYLILVQVVAVTDADWAAMATIIDTFRAGLA